MLKKGTSLSDGKAWIVTQEDATCLRPFQLEQYLLLVCIADEHFITTPGTETVKPGRHQKLDNFSGILSCERTHIQKQDTRLFRRESAHTLHVPRRLVHDVRDVRNIIVCVRVVFTNTRVLNTAYVAMRAVPTIATEMLHLWLRQRLCAARERKGRGMTRRTDGRDVTGRWG